jgi:prevent-host-death family protein
MTVNIHEAKTHFSRLIERAARGEEIIVAKSGKPLVRIVPLEGRPQEHRPGLSRGLGEISDDFDEPLPEEILAEFEK